MTPSPSVASSRNRVVTEEDARAALKRLGTLRRQHEYALDASCYEPVLQYLLAKRVLRGIILTIILAIYALRIGYGFQQDEVRWGSVFIFVVLFESLRKLISESFRQKATVEAYIAGQPPMDAEVSLISRLHLNYPSEYSNNQKIKQGHAQKVVDEKVIFHRRSAQSFALWGPVIGVLLFFALSKVLKRAFQMSEQNNALFLNLLISSAFVLFTLYLGRREFRQAETLERLAHQCRSEPADSGAKETPDAAS